MESLQIRIAEPAELSRCHQLLDQHHYLGSPKPVGERLYYVVTDAQGQWRAVLIFAAASKHLRARDQWIGWTDAQREKRLALVVNNIRFLLVPERSFPNLGTKSLRLALSRLSGDWQAKYGHPVLVVETFVDPEQFCGTVYRANGWEELGQTDGCGRHQRDYYVRHDKPKRLFVRELCRRARRSLQAEHLKPALAGVEAKAGVRSRHTVKEIGSIIQQLKEVPDYRKKIGTYPLWSLLALYLLAVWCEAPRGSKDLAKFARKLSQDQRRALGIRQRRGRYPTPSQPTCWRLLEEISGPHLEQALLQVQTQLRGPAPKKELIALDGKQPKHGGGQSVLTAVCVPSQYLLGQRGGRHQDQRDPRGPKTLSRLGPQGPVRLAGCPAHPDRNGSPDRAGGRRGLPADGQRQPTQASPKHRAFAPRPQGGFSPLGSRRPRSIAPSSTKRATT